MKITVVSVSTSIFGELIRACKYINKIYNNILDLKLYYVSRIVEEDKLRNMVSDIEDADMTIVDLMGAGDKNVKATYNALENCKGQVVIIGTQGREYLKLGNLTSENMNKKETNNKICRESMKKMMDIDKKLEKSNHMKNYINIGRYWHNAGFEDMKNLLYLILRDYGKHEEIPKPLEPVKREGISICNPSTMEFFNSYEEYAKKYDFNKKRSIVALIFYGHSYPSKTSNCVAEIANRIKEFANVVPIAFCSVINLDGDKLKSMLENVCGKKVDLILNFMSFRLGAGPMGGDANRAIETLRKIEAPMLHPFFMTKKTENEWMESVQGITSSEFLISVMLPELDGAIETYPVGAMKCKEINEEFNIELNELNIIEERVEKLIGKIKGWLNLRQKSNKDKKVAIVCYNYPPGEDNLFGGAFLNTFKSIEKILGALKNEGYNTENLTSEDLMSRFCGKIVNSGKWISEENINKMIKYKNEKYRKYIQNKNFYNDMIEQWGEVPGNVMSLKENFLIPGIENKNVFIGLQPSRGVHENTDKIYHDKSMLPHHQYIAFYKWIKEEFKADVVIHVGTHGTIEFLKGKECGMSGDCFPDMLLYDIPHLYLYYIGNPAEAMIAKRRSHAVMVSYSPPCFMEGELYGEYVLLQNLIEEYHECKRLDPTRCSEVLKSINKKAKDMNMNFGDLEELERELYRMNRSLVPRGLHIFGEGYNEDEVFNYIKFILRYDRENIKCLRRIVCENRGLDYNEIIEQNNTDILASLDSEVEWIMDNFKKYKDLSFIDNSEKIYKRSLIEDIIKSIEYGKKISLNIRKNFEIAGLLKAMNGKYLNASLAGDVIRNPEILPSGYNLYQFDPTLVPTETAYKRGASIAKKTIELYYKENKRYPWTTAMILWGLETSRTGGETIGQILYYLGVRPVKTGNSFKSAYEIIPIEELKRPRIDITINICGFFRDMFPNLIEDLNKIFYEIHSLDETFEENYFKKNSKDIYDELIKNGTDEETAKELCISRIFGPKEAEYGTGITKLLETKAWEEEVEIGKNFIDSLKYVYSKNFRGKEVEGLYTNNLKTVDVVSQVRSNHEYEITDLDHYYEFFGGLSKSIEMIKGEKPSMYISDTTGERVETETVDKSINRGIRTRILNPKWIDGMLEHKYHGVQKIADRFENILGLAATTNSVEQWIYNDLHKKYIENEKLRKRLQENNPYAYVTIVEWMMEYNQRGYWDASDEQLKELRDVYLEAEGLVEEL
ncbi:MAG: magnesium chelatase subunit H [Clostridium cochlearium]|uniref:Magnesium chelatase subunit H n=1 Tax=Clostridium cochlearium TaxID=1494 RepID=A0A7Y4DEB9_CLOCO|nr:magnesium chelatase subunit H [Clostridium cochlearium]MCR1970757.1 magnesium chelatase subunit H [Clostridium cochlearium]MDU1443442.1 magnesium chelatase subunit H [Clostridium cochlearium]NOH16769.1 magnesium chelatase subunit H [Clostridium cochlearium]